MPRFYSIGIIPAPIPSFAPHGHETWEIVLYTFGRGVSHIGEQAIPFEPGTIICNPPYGERLGEEKEVQEIYRAMGDFFALKCPGWRCWVFTGNIPLIPEFDLPIEEKVNLWNGAIPSQFVRFKT